MRGSGHSGTNRHIPVWVGSTFRAQLVATDASSGLSGAGSGSRHGAGEGGVGCRFRTGQKARAQKVEAVDALQSHVHERDLLDDLDRTPVSTETEAPPQERPPTHRLVVCREHYE